MLDNFIRIIGCVLIGGFVFGLIYFLIHTSDAGETMSMSGTFFASSVSFTFALIPICFILLAINEIKYS